MIEIILLAVIALAEITRLVLSYKKPTRKAHFKSKLEGSLKMIWDLEFKRFKTLEIREEVRQEYDNLKARIGSFADKVKNWPKDGSLDEKKRVEDEIVRAEADTKRYEAQMKQLDEEVNGAKATNDNPDGVVGITQQIESMRELTEMLQDHISNL